jgi:hypothetical protein
MIWLILALIGGGIAGAVTGSLVTTRRLKQHRDYLASLEAAQTHPWEAHRINEAATAWAHSNGQPEIGQLLAAKLRLVNMILKLRRDRDMRRGWWR